MGWRTNLSLLLFAFCTPAGLTFGQDGGGCFGQFLDQGIQAYYTQEFEKAIKSFNAAEICPDKPNNGDALVLDWKGKARNGFEDYIDSLNVEFLSLRSEMNALRDTISNLLYEREALANDKLLLTQKLRAATVVFVENVEIEGLSIQENGSWTTTRSSDKTDLIRVRFTLRANPNMEPGKEAFMVKIINPVGETLVDDEQGPGIFFNEKYQDLSFYTKMTEAATYQHGTSLTAEWRVAKPMMPGRYDAEIYNKGYLCGNGNLWFR